jgi:hypothetical protein
MRVRQLAHLAARGVAVLAVPMFALGCEKKGAGDSPSSASPSASLTAAVKPAVATRPSVSASTPPSASAASKETPPRRVTAGGGTATIPAGFTAKGTRKGAPAFAYRSALAYRYEGSKVLHLELSTHARGCGDVGADERALADGESIADLALAPQIGKPGPSGWAVMEIADQDAKGTTSYVLARRADARIDAGDPAHEVRVVVSNAKPATAGELVVDGAIVAQGCGAFPDPWAASDPDLKARPQARLTLEIDGQKLAVNGALHFGSRKQIVLSTHPLSCTRDAAEDDVTLRLAENGDRANFGGYMVDAAERDVDLEPAVKVTLQEFKFGRETDDVKLSGAFTIAGHHGKLSGSATLLACQ